MKKETKGDNPTEHSEMSLPRKTVLKPVPVPWTTGCSLSDLTVGLRGRQTEGRKKPRHRYYTEKTTLAPLR